MTDPYRGTPFEVRVEMALQKISRTVTHCHNEIHRIRASQEKGDGLKPSKKERGIFWPPLALIAVAAICLLASQLGPSLADRQWAACAKACPKTHSQAVNVRTMRVYGPRHAEYSDPGEHPLARCTCISVNGEQLYRFVTVRK